MTVKELIKELELIEDKNLDVVVYDGFGMDTDLEISKSIQYYGKQEEWGWCSCNRECILID